MKKLIWTAMTVVVLFQFQIVSSWAACVAGDVTAPTMVTDLRTNAIAGTGIIYSFTAPTDASTLAEIDLRYRTTPLTVASWGTATQATGEPTTPTSGTTQCANLNGLSAGVTYYMAIKVKDACGKWSAMSNVKSFKTTAQAKTSATVTWGYTPPSEPAVLGFKLYWGHVSGVAEFFQNTENVDQTEVVLEPGDYFFWLTARFSDGTESPSSSIVAFSVPSQ